MWGGTQYKRAGYPDMTSARLRVLDRLAESADAGQPWVEMHIKSNLARTLVNMDLIVISVDRYTGTRAYKITGRGRDVLAAYKSPMKRYDGMCPRCGRPRAEGKRYCVDCHRDVNRAAATAYRKRQQSNPIDAPCSQCGERPRAVSQYGIQQALCVECAYERGRDYRARRQERLRERIANGEVVICTYCGKRPVQVTENRVAQRCRECSCRQARQCRQKHKRESLRIIQAITRKRGSDAAD